MFLFFLVASSVPSSFARFLAPLAGKAKNAPTEPRTSSVLALAAHQREELRSPGDPWSVGRPTDRLGDGGGWQWPGQKKRGGRAGAFNPKAQGTGDFQPGAGTVTSRQSDGLMTTNGKDNDGQQGRGGPGEPMYPGGPMHRTYTGPVTLWDLWQRQPPYVWMVLICAVGLCVTVPFLMHAAATSGDEGGEQGQDGLGTATKALLNPPRALCLIGVGLAVVVLLWGVVAFSYQFGAWGVALIGLVAGSIMVLGSLKPLGQSDDEEGSKDDEGVRIHQSMLILGLLIVLTTVLYFLYNLGFFDFFWRIHVMLWHNWWLYALVGIVIAALGACFLSSRTAGEMAQDYREEWNSARPRPGVARSENLGRVVMNIG